MTLNCELTLTLNNEANHSHVPHVGIRKMCHTWGKMTPLSNCSQGLQQRSVAIDFRPDNDTGQSLFWPLQQFMTGS